MKKGFMKVASSAALAVAAAVTMAAPVSAADPNWWIASGARPEGSSVNFTEPITVKPGATVEVQVVVRNQGTIPLHAVEVDAAMPNGVTFVSGSTRVFNYSTGREGKLIEDITSVRNIGPYAVYDGNERGIATIQYKVKIADSSAFTCGNGTHARDIRNRMGGYDGNGNPATNTHISYTKLHVEAPACAGGANELPQTGPAEIAGAVIGLGSIATAATYYVRSRKKA